MKYSHFLLIAAVFASGPAAAGVVIVPGSGSGNAQAPTPFNYYGSSGSRVQQIYESSYFPSAELIDGFSFRAYPGAAPNFFIGNHVNISNVNIQLSTTSAGANETGALPSANFADNVGSNVKTVYSGALSLSTAATGVGAQPFDYTVNFSTPFLYDPRLGNLLLDVTIPTGATVSGPGFGFLTFDTVNSLNDGIYSVVDINSGSSATGALSTAGAITEFSTMSTAVPEPSTWALLISGFGLLAFAKLKRRESALDLS